MSDYKDKIITSQTISNDLVAEISSLLSRDDFEKDDLRPVYERIRQLSDILNDIPAQDIKF